MPSLLSASVLALSLLPLLPILAANDRGEGVLVVDEETTYLSHAYAYSAAGLFDPAIRETLLLLTDRPLLKGLSPDDEPSLIRLVKKGEMQAFRLRLGASGVLSASLYHPAWEGGKVVLTSLDFQGGLGQGREGYAFGRVRSLEGASFDGHSWSCDLAFDARIQPAIAADETN